MDTLSEDQLQAACFRWSWNEKPETRRCLFAIPNGGKRSPTEAMRLKATGVISGVHDILFVWQGRSYFMELKVGNNRQSKEQIAFGEAVKAQGAILHEVRSLEQFKEIINGIVNPSSTLAGRMNCAMNFRGSDPLDIPIK